jgi:hypothetical protein
MVIEMPFWILESIWKPLWKKIDMSLGYLLNISVNPVRYFNNVWFMFLVF